MQVGQDLDVHGDHGGTRRGKRFDVPVRVGDHQVNIQRDLRDPLQRSDHRWADRDVRHEVAVHDVDMDQISAAPLHGGDRRSEGGEIGRQDGRRDLHRYLRTGQRLTSIEIASPGVI